MQLLLQGCKKNDRESQRLLYQHYYGYAMSICVRYCRSFEESKEIVNDGFMKVNKEWFKVMNVSLILQKKLNNRFYFEFEPFLKAPLAGVGEGEVSLVSLGAFFNLRFDIPINKP